MIAETKATPEQRAAIDLTSNRRVLICGPGTGKTFTLVEIIADLIERRGRSAECITAVSFTKNAAGELKERVVKRIGPKAFGITFGTAHSVALKIVRSRARELGYASPEITVYDEQDKRDVMKDVIATLKSDLGIEKALELLFELRNDLAGEWPAAHFRVVREYEARLMRACAIDLDGILPLALRILRTDARALSDWSRTARYLIVDEYHDTAPEEAALYAALSPKEVVIVGDPNQEIYRFRGTTNEFLLGAAKAEGAAVFYLTQSFRSGSKVVDAANALISHNPPQPEEKLRPAIVGGSVEVVDSPTFEAQAEAFREFARGALGDSLSCAILARTNRELSHVVRALKEKAVPVHELSIDRSFYALDEVRAFHGALRAAWNPRDEIAASLVCRYWPGVPRPKSAEWFAARQEANATDEPLLRVLRWSTVFDADCPKGSRSLSLRVCAQYCAKSIGSAFRDAGLTTRAENVEKAAEKALDFAETWNTDELSDFLDWLQHRELREARANARKGPAVECGTIHAAKGLEWDVVAIAGCHEGVMPIGTADEREERRLAYVGVTRARRSLRLFTCRETDRERSRFLEEMGL